MRAEERETREVSSRSAANEVCLALLCMRDATAGISEIERVNETRTGNEGSDWVGWMEGWKREEWAP